MKVEEKAEEFLKTAGLYHLGDLLTESPHPDTTELSHWAQKDPVRAAEILAQVDKKALGAFRKFLPQIAELKKAVGQQRQAGQKLYLVGCGATGRLCLTIEALYREQTGKDDVIALMAGGDTALVHSLEGFEDFPEYGARHLEELGFGAQDLLIAVTEGGETPYVIGALERAAEISEVAPYFLYCNPDEILCEKVERSRRVIQNPGVHKINLSVGPMALAGSTRMQASTVQQLAVGLAVLEEGQEEDWAASLDELVQALDSSYAKNIGDFIEEEASVYKNDGFVLYEVKSHYISVFTDTTERSPTFSLLPFEHKNSQRPPSLCYISLPEANDAAAAWRLLFGREPRPLDWGEVDAMATPEYLRSFNFGVEAKLERESRGARPQSTFAIGFDEEAGFHFHLGSCERRVPVVARWSPLWQHTYLKLFLNTHSTLVMGVLDRYKNNMMTYVFPTNGKLIDRAARYVKWLLAHEEKSVNYEKIVRQIFIEMESLKERESIVLKVYNHFANSTA